MNAMIRDSFYTATVAMFDAYPDISPALAKEIEDWKAEFTAYCESITDVAAFAGQYYGSDLQVRSSNLITKAAMEAMGGANQQNSAETEADVVSVKEFVEQYRTSYNEVKAQGYRKRGEAAYEAVFNVANRTDDMIEAQIIMEDERLLWKIVSEDSLDIFETILEAMDPLYDMVTYPIRAYAETYRMVNSDEELTYELERVKQEIPRTVEKSTVRIRLAALLGTNLLNYAKGRLQIREWASDKSASEGLSTMLACRQNILKVLGVMKKCFNLTFDDIANDEFSKLWMLNPRGLDSLNRIKRVLNPENLEAYKAIIAEVTSEKSVYELLMEEAPYTVYFDLDAKDKEYNRRAEAKARELNSGLAYYRYEDRLKSTVEGMCTKLKKK